MANCIFEVPKGGKCKPHKLQSFKHVICEAHLLYVFGLSTNIKQFIKPDMDVQIGPFLNVANGHEFQVNDVLIPSKGFLDRRMALQKKEDDDEIETLSDAQYRLNPYLDNFMRRLMSGDNKADGYFQAEIVRNMLLAEPLTDVDMVLGSDDVKSSLKTKVQTHLAQIQSNIQNQDYYKFIEKNIIVHAVGRGGKVFSAFERFLWFNMMCDRTSFTRECIPEMLNYNLTYNSEVGYVVTTAATGAIDLVLNANCTIDDRYFRWKERKTFKSCTSKSFASGSLADSQNPHNIIERCRGL